MLESNRNGDGCDCDSDGWVTRMIAKCGSTTAARTETANETVRDADVSVPLFKAVECNMLRDMRHLHDPP